MTFTESHTHDDSENVESELSDSQLRQQIESLLFKYMDYALSQGKAFEDDLIPGFDILSAISFDLNTPKEKVVNLIREILNQKPYFEYSCIQGNEITTLLSFGHDCSIRSYGTFYSMDKQLVKMFYFSRTIATYAKSTIGSFVNENLSDFLNNNDEHLFLGHIPILKKETQTNLIYIASNPIEYDSTVLTFIDEDFNFSLQLNLLNRNNDFLKIFTFALKDEFSMKGLLKLDSVYNYHQINSFKNSLKEFLF